MENIQTKPLVSSIIIFLNGEVFITEAIDSIFAQTYDNWELLLVDDGSTDRSTAIALDYAQKYPERVRYLEHENHQNLGTSVSRNLGIEFARGDYIAFLDADDVWLPLKLAQQVAIFAAHPEVAMVYGASQHWYSWTGNPEDRKQDHFLDLGVSPNTVVMPPELLPLLWKNDNFQYPLPSNAIVRRSVYDTIGQFDESFRVFAEDLVFYTKLELKYPVFVSSEYWIRYRKHQDSVTAQLTTGKEWHQKVEQPFFNWTENYLIEQGLKNTDIWRTFYKILWPYRHPILYFFWRGYLEFLMSIGRKILPISLRHWLWLTIGGKLYHHPAQANESTSR
jgi:glycosyltransferase involved in cell wall biosynthesis